MPLLFGFRTRNPSRDRETDEARFTRLATLIDEIAAQIRAERAGLEKRYLDASANAGFLMAAMDNDEGPQHSSARLDAMTSDVLNCERRLDALSRQVALLEDLRKRAEGLLGEASSHKDDGEAQAGSVTPTGVS